MDVELVGLALQQLVRHAASRPRSLVTSTAPRTSSARTCSATASKVSRCRCPARRGEDVRAPLVVGDPQRSSLCVAPSSRGPAGRTAAAARVAPAAHDGLERRAVPVGGLRLVRPLGDPASGGLAHRGADERRRLRRQRPQPRASTWTRPWWVTSSPAKSARMTSTHSRSRAARVALRPAVAGDVLVDASPEPRRDPQPAREHLAERRRRLREDRRVVALAGGVRPRRRAGRSVASAAPSHDQAKPDSPWRALHGEKWSEDIPPSRPAASAARARQQRAGAICSCEWCSPRTGTSGRPPGRGWFSPRPGHRSREEFDGPARPRRRWGRLGADPGAAARQRDRDPAIRGSDMPRAARTSRRLSPSAYGPAGWETLPAI